MDELQILPVPADAKELQRYIDAYRAEVNKVFALPPRMLKRYPKPVLMVSNPK